MTPSGYYQIIPIAQTGTSQSPWPVQQQQVWPQQGQWGQNGQQYPISGQIGGQYPVGGQYPQPTGQQWQNGQQMSTWQTNPYQVVPPTQEPQRQPTGQGTIIVIPYYP